MSIHMYVWRCTTILIFSVIHFLEERATSGTSDRAGSIVPETESAGLTIIYRKRSRRTSNDDDAAFLVVESIIQPIRLEIANHYSMLMISQLLLFNWNFCGIVFFATTTALLLLPQTNGARWVQSIPAGSTHTLDYTLEHRLWRKWIWKAKFSWVHIVSHPERAPKHQPWLWFMTFAALSLCVCIPLSLLQSIYRHLWWHFIKISPS